MEQIGEGLDEASPAATNSRPGDRSRRAARVLAAIVLTIVGATLAWADEPRFFRIGTAGTTGTYFQVGGILASAISGRKRRSDRPPTTRIRSRPG